jgi:hypothetical protein
MLSTLYAAIIAGISTTVIRRLDGAVRRRDPS